MLTLHHVGFSQSQVTLLSDINFSVGKGQTIGLLGVNGAGKSTTLKIAAGILLPSAGRVIRETSLRIGYLPERPPVIEQWTVGRFLRHVAILHQLPTQQVQLAIERVVELCDLARVFHRSIGALSKGNQQRVAIAQAMIHEPDVLLLDEPTSGLDPQQIMQFRELLKTIQAETAIVLSSHIMQEVTALCNRAVIIHEGRQVADISLDAQENRLLVTFSEPISTTLAKQLPYWHSGQQQLHQFTVHSTVEQDALLAACLQKGLSVVRLSGVEQVLESEFLARIGQSAQSAMATTEVTQ